MYRINNYGTSEKKNKNATDKADLLFKKSAEQNAKAFSDVKKFFLMLVLAIALILSTKMTFASDLLEIQGTATQNGTAINGNITVTIWDQQAGGSLIYNSSSDFNNYVINGRYDLTLGSNVPLNLEYGKYYYMDFTINGEDMDFNGSERKIFQSSVGNITGQHVKTDTINSTQIADDSIVDSDININALISKSKISSVSTWIESEIPSLTNSWAGTLNASRIVNEESLNVNSSSYLNGYTATNFLSNDTSLSNRIDAKSGLGSVQCSGSDKLVNITLSASGITYVCGTDQTGAAGNNYTTNFISYKIGSTVYLNMTRIDGTVLNTSFTDADTTYTNSTGILLSGNTFLIDIDYFSGIFYNKSEIDTSLNNKLDLSDQRYNDTAKILNVNSTANIQTLGFNTTTQLDSKYYSASNPSGYITNSTMNKSVNASNVLNAPWISSYTETDPIYTAEKTGIQNNITAADTRVTALNSSGGFITNNTMNKTVNWSNIINNPAFITDGNTNWDNSYGLLTNDTMNKSVNYSNIQNAPTFLTAETDPIYTANNASIVHKDTQNITDANIKCGNITGATSNLCTLVDTDTSNTTTQMRSAINNSGQYNITVNASLILNAPWITTETTYNAEKTGLQTNNSLAQSRIDWINTTAGFITNSTMNKSVNWSSITSNVYEAEKTGLQTNDTLSQNEINQVNTTVNIQNLGFNTTTQLDTKYIASTTPVANYYLPGMNVRNGTWLSGFATNTALGTIALTSGTVWCSPMIVGKGYKIDQIQFRVTTLLANAVAVAGIYNDTGNLYPDTLVTNGSMQATTTTGLKVDTMNAATINSNSIYWLCITGNSTATVTGIPLASQFPILGHDGTASNSMNTLWRFTRTLNTTNPWNNLTTYPPGAAMVTNTVQPMVQFRVRTDI